MQERMQARVSKRETDGETHKKYHDGIEIKW